MQENEFFNNFYVDRVPPNTNLLEIIEQGDYESALLMSLQLMSDIIVHSEEYIPRPKAMISNITRKSSSNLTDD